MIGVRERADPRPVCWADDLLVYAVFIGEGRPQTRLLRR